MHYLEFEKWFKENYPTIVVVKSEYTGNDLYYSGEVLLLEHALKTGWCSFSSDVHQLISKELPNLDFKSRMNLLWQITVGIFEINAALSGYRE